MNLAYAEIYLCLANVFWEFPEMKLCETTEDDVRMVADNFMPKASGRGVGVLLS